MAVRACQPPGAVQDVEEFEALEAGDELLLAMMRPFYLVEFDLQTFW
jgi:hypothetical protein